MKNQNNTELKAQGSRIFRALSITVFSFLCGCGGGGGGSDVGPENQVSLSGNVRTITADEAKSVVSSVVRENGDRQIVIKPSGTLSNVAIGTVLNIPATTEDEYPLVLKVTGATVDSSGSTVVVARPALPDEVFSSISYKYDSDVDGGGVSPVIRVLTAADVVGVLKNGTDRRSAQQLGSGITFKTNGGVDGRSFSAVLNQFIVVPSSKYKDDNSSILGCQNITADASWAKEHCIKYTLTGTVDLKVGRSSNSIKSSEGSDGKLVFASDVPQKMTQQFTLGADITATLIGKDFSTDDLWSGEQKKIYEKYSQTLFSTKDDFIRARVSGLSADDKRGKFPLFGMLLNTGTLMTAATSKEQIAVASAAGAVVWVYGVVDVTAEGVVTIKAVLEPMTTTIGMEVVDGAMQAVKTTQNADGGSDLKATLSANAEGKITAKGGASLEADFFVAGVRFANAGAFVGVHSVLTGGLQAGYRFPAVDSNGKIIGGLFADGCGELTSGWGLNVTGNLALQGDIKIGKGWGQYSNSLGIAYGFSIPYALDKAEADFPLWKVIEGPKRCYSTTAPEISILISNESQRLTWRACEEVM